VSAYFICKSGGRRRISAQQKKDFGRQQKRPMQQKTHKTILLGQNYDALPITRCDTEEMLLDTLRKKTKPRQISIMDDACTVNLTKKKIFYIGTLNKNSRSSGSYSDEEALIRSLCPP
jgi:hypothetical protein